MSQSRSPYEKRNAIAWSLPAQFVSVPINTVVSPWATKENGRLRRNLDLLLQTNDWLYGHIMVSLGVPLNLPNDLGELPCRKASIVAVMDDLVGHETCRPYTYVRLAQHTSVQHESNISPQNDLNRRVSYRLAYDSYSTKRRLLV